MNTLGGPLAVAKSACALALCCFSTSVYGQETISVPIFVSATKSTLRADDIRVEVNGKPSKVVSIRHLSGEPLHYVLLNDESGRNRWPGGTKQQRDLASRFLKQVVTPGADTGSLVNFGDDVYIDLQLSTNPDEIASKLPQRGVGATRMYDAISSSARFLAKHSDGERKVLFLFSDGEDNGSKVTLQDAIEALQQTRIPLFIIAPDSVEKKKQGARLQQLATASGGRCDFLPRDSRQVGFDSLKRALDEEFLLGLAVESSVIGWQSLAVTNAANPQTPITAPSRIALP